MHRDDIDGLRTLAVLPVIAFHYVIFPKVFGGGFVGVDIFFVISGYLITRNIFHDVTNRTYNIVDFYNRRIRRIFPALFTIFAFCIVVAFLTSFPSEAAKISESIISSVFFVSNYLFYSQSGYFDRSSETNPLLHMWSLSVEEQFYVIFPIVIYLIRDFSANVRILFLGTATIASLLYSIWMVSINPDAAFFLVQFRAWELLIGSLLAINAIPNLTHQWQAELVGAGGIALIVISVVFISPNTPFPGIAALAPCAGAAAVIHAGSATRTLAGRLLAFSPIRFIGLISYSLYLWHWPLIVFYRLFVNQPSRIEKSALLFICFAAATLSWKLIEKPFRAKPQKSEAFRTISAGGAVMVLTAAACLALPSLIASVFAYPSRAIEVLSHAKIDEGHMRSGTCFFIPSDNRNFTVEYFVKNGCLVVSPKSLNYLIVGDSHAAHLWAGLKLSYPAINFLQATMAGCTPIVEKGRSTSCSEMTRFIFEKFLPNTHLDGIIISAQWRSDEALPQLIQTANIARSYVDRVIVFGPMVEYDQALPRILARAIASHESETVLANLHRLPLPGAIDSFFSAAFKNEAIEYVSVYRALCDQECKVWASENVPLQFDGNHLTCEGSIELAKKVGPQLFPHSVLVDADGHACEGAALGLSGKMTQNK